MNILHKQMTKNPTLYNMFFSTAGPNVSFTDDFFYIKSIVIYIFVNIKKMVKYGITYTCTAFYLCVALPNSLSLKHTITQRKSVDRLESERLEHYSYIKCDNS